MRILHVITRLILGGAQQNTVMSCAAQAAAGHEVHLAYGPIHGPEGSLLQEARASGATLHEIPSLVRQVAPLKDRRCYRALRGLVRELRPDLVHSHSSKAGILARAAAWAQIRDAEFWALASRELDDVRPGVVVHTVHGLPFHDQQNPLTHAVYVALERYAARRCDHLIAIAPEMVDAFVERGIAPREKFTVIPSGVELSRFSEAALPRPDDAKRAWGLDPARPVVGLVARLDPLKGHRDLLHAYRRINEDTPGVQLLIVGEGYDGAAIRSAFNAEQAGDHTVFTGLVPFDRMPAVYRAIDVCVLPSYQEGQSRVLVEALAAGCGIVAYDAGGIPSVCIDGVTGTLVRVGDIHALAAAVGEQLRDPARRRGLVESGQRHIRERFSAQAMTAALEALYRRLRACPA